MTRKKQLKGTALDRMLKEHRALCGMKRYSDREKRKCTCGRDEAVKELAGLRAKAQNVD